MIPVVFATACTFWAQLYDVPGELTCAILHVETGGTYRNDLTGAAGEVGAAQIHQTAVPRLAREGWWCITSGLRTADGAACAANALLDYWHRRCGGTWRDAASAYNRGRCTPNARSRQYATKVIARWHRTRPGAYQRRVERVERRLRWR